MHYEEFPIISRPLFRRARVAGKSRHYRFQRPILRFRTAHPGTNRLKTRDAEGELRRTAGSCGDVAGRGGGEIGRSDFDGVAL